MTLTFPLTLTQFAGVFGKMSVRFWLENNQESSGVASGQMIVANLGPRYWMAEMGIINMSNDDARAVQALIEALDGGINPFFLNDPRCNYPAYDPDGSIISGHPITNTNVASNGKEMKFTGFPAGYVISPGDMFCFSYGSGGAYQALHRVVVGDTANGSGNTDWIEFRPNLAQPSLATGVTMDFTRPYAKFILLPDAFDPGTAQQMLTTGMKIKARQIP